ncbi:Transcriptional regulator Myc-B [Channa argus]|uniref:Transcriptional regulator n=1 Tax=Channa argus TaxID=215402 RepID=A0A6G1Q7E4_CHAAH|nr:Transcriptional regulator Myc-B [Channa argus]
MPPVLTMSSKNYDYDYDTVQPYFFLDGEEEDFYPPPRSQLLPGPSEDIWKKFELLPTPPLSPSRSPSHTDIPLSASDHLEVVSELLDEDRNPSAAFLQSFIIQDCMWSSSFAATTKLEKVVSERLALLRARQTPSSSTTSNTTEAADQQGTRSEMSPGYLQDLHSAATDCIDPSVVFPYTTVNEKSGDEAAVEVVSERCLDSPPLSSSDSESEEEEDDEEIDVVTVERRKAYRRSDTSPLVLKRSHINIHQHNYAAQQPSAPHEQPALKRVRSEASCTALKQSNGRRCWSPRSDGEDSEDRRKTHNVLERQRRNELKMSFLALRDEVPAVAKNDKAAKVVILKKATEFVVELRKDERRLLTTKDELRKRSRELRLRLEQLRT